VRVLITGGAGFVGSRLAAAFRRDGADVVALDNLRRRGSEGNVTALARLGVRFVHGDVRHREDLDDLEGTFDVLVDASAEPSVHAGVGGAPSYVIQTNLVGTLNCLELARSRAGALVFLSSSRVYSLAPLRGLALEERPTRLALRDGQAVPGVSHHGIAEGFPTDGPRSLYGASKLAAELFVQEYAETFGLRAVIDRCGVISGAGQFGRSEQGVVALWVANHHFGLPLRYTGFGGEGKQVRDLLHPEDLYALVRIQLGEIDRISGRAFNAGGGLPRSVSMLELTGLCREATGREVDIASVPETSPVDIPLYVSDNARAEAELGWTPERGPADIVAEIAAWLAEREAELRPLFAPAAVPVGVPT
jgi:CDP-paratose 2-epimerase